MCGVKEKFKYTKSMRLLNSKEFRVARRSGIRLCGKFIHLYLYSRSHYTHSPTQLGLTVPRRFGKAHERNRFKRTMREVFRLSYPSLSPSLALEVQPYPSAKEASYQEIQTDFLTLTSNAGYRRF